MKFRLAATAVTALLIGATAPAVAEEHVSAETVVATVNGTDITLAHMIVLKSRLPAQYRQLPPDTLFEGILDQLVQQTLLGDQLDELSTGSIASLENEERAARASEVIRDIATEATSDEALQAAYDERFADVEAGTEYNASHILVETEEEAQALIEQLEGGADFAELAKENSTGPSGPNGGELGWFGAGAMVKPFEEAVLALQAGEVSPPVQTQFGWHVVKLNETRDQALPTLEEVRGELVEQIQRTAIEARVAELEEGAEIDRSGAEGLDPTILDNAALLDN